MKKDEIKKDLEFNRSDKEFAHLHKSEFQGTNQEFFEENIGQKADKKKENRQNHRKLLRKMSYLVVSVIAAVNIFSTTDDLERNVKRNGGTVDRDFRFTIQWNDNGKNGDDLDAICIEPDGYVISYLSLNSVSPSGGFIDIDIRVPGENLAIENIVYKERDEMQEGTYLLSVNCFAKNNGKGGFKAQIEALGKVYNFKYNKTLSEKETVDVAKVTLKDGKFTVERLLK